MTSKINIKDELKTEEDEYNIKIFRRTLENYTHEVIEDTKIKKITSWRKSQKKFFQSLILNIFTLGIIHIISLFSPSLYIKLYCNRRKPKECDFFLVEDIYGNLTLCKKIYKKDKSQSNISSSSDRTKESIISSSLSNYSNKFIKSLTKNLTYSFKYRSTTYEYNESTNEITPVYMNLLNLTCKDIFHYFSEGLTSEAIVNIFQSRYGKNEYVLNFHMEILYFLNVELPNLILVIIIGIIEICLADYISFFSKLIIISILLILEYLNMKLNIYDLYKKEYTLDGEKNKIRAKRSYKMDEKSEIFCKIDNCDLLPGDIILLKSNDIVPCDCLILEGECMANCNNLIGNLNIERKVSLENKNIPFNYQQNKDNILYHGMKIVKTYSNLKQDYISVLCINTGPNTFKANLFSNTLYLFERKKEYKETFKLFNSERKSFCLIFIFIFFFSVIIGIIYIFLVLKSPEESLKLKDREKLNLYIIILIRTFCKSTMPMFYLINSISILLGIGHLKKENIFIFEKSKLLCSSNIDTVFIGKTGTLCEDKFEINGYHPISVNHHNINNLGFRTYNINQNKELNMQLVKYYKDYLNNNINEYCKISYKKDSKFDSNKCSIEKATQKCCEYSTLFLESLLSCNNLDKYGMEIFGNTIDSEIFKSMKWDIKTDINNSNIDSDIDYPYHKTDDASNYSKISYYEKTRNDIFPSNYYKITESMKNKNTNQQRNSNNPINISYTTVEEEKGEHRDSLLNNNIIENDISQSHINSYKIRIYKRFIKDNALSSSSISFNFITKELRFNTKGIPEDILDKCNPITIPENFDKILSFHRRRGLIVIICAGKKLNVEQYSEIDSEDKYMNNLTFYGFITLKNKLKDGVIYALNELREFNCDFIISTGDDIYNTLSVGFESTILENKDIYSFEKDEIKNRIVIKKIYNSNNSTNDKEEENDNNKSSDNMNINRHSRVSKNYNKILDKSFKSSKFNLKQSKLFENSESNLNNYFKPEKKTDQFNLDGHNPNVIKENTNELNTPKNRNHQNGYSNNMFISSKNILNTTGENSKNNSISLTNKQIRNKLKTSRKNMNSFDFNFLETPTKSFISTRRTINIDKNEILYYYQGIFEDHKELSENCIYCIDAKVFDFLYQNKNKRHAKMLLEKIHEKCRIFYNMTSLSKSKVIDYYREFKDKCICSIGECQSDIDSLISSDIGINLQSPKNLNTILYHFYSPEACLLAIKKIIRAGRAIKENNILMKIACIIYTLLINSYITVCFIWEIDVIQGQLNLIEITSIFLSIAAFTSKVDNSEEHNSFIKKKKLYFCHYAFQIGGLILIKAIGVYFHATTFNINDFLEEEKVGKIYCTFYFAFCVEQLISTIDIVNLICFYRESCFLNTAFILFSLVIIFYFVGITIFTNSNYNIDIFGFLYFEYYENIVDAYDENNKITLFIICFVDFFASLIYSRIVYHIFNRLAKNDSYSKK